MSKTNAKLNKLWIRDQFLTGAIVLAIASGMVGMGLLLNILYEPMNHARYMTGSVVEYRVSQNGGHWGGSNPYWVVAVGEDLPALIKEPPDRDFRRGKLICIEMTEGVWTKRRKHRIARDDKCASL